MLFSLCILNGCSYPVDSNNKQENSQPTDSVQFYLSEENSYSNAEFKRNLAKAYALAKNVKKDSLKSKYFSELSYYYLSEADSTKFRKSNILALEYSRKIGDSATLANNHWDLASFFDDYAVEDSAYYHYSAAEKIYRALNDTYYSARMLYNMALIQSEIKDYIGSEINTIKAIELFEPLKKYENLFHCYSNLGSLSNALKEYDRALEYYDEALFYLDKVDPNSSAKLGAYNNIGVVYQQMGLHKEAMESFNKVISVDSIKIKNTRNYATAISNYALSQSKLGDSSGVLDKLTEVLHVRDSLNDIRGLAVIQYQIADHYLSLGDSTKALEFALRGKENAVQSSSNLRILELLALLGKIDPKNATSYTHEYIKLNDSLIHEERTLQNKFTRIRFETDQFIEQNVLLARQRQLWIGIAVGILAVAALLLLMFNQLRKNQKLRFEQAQQKANQEIFNLLLAQNTKMEQGKQLEKKRVSEELHDGILGQMLGIRLILTGLNNKTDDTSVLKRAELLKKLQNLEEEIRTISHELSRASEEKIHNFIVSVKELLQTVEDSSDMTCEFKYDHNIDWDQLTADLKINIYRIVQENLQNCIKHSRATQVVVAFEHEGNQLNITISDNGVGFNAKKGKRGIGLKNIKSRLEKLNGTYSINSQVGNGTKVMVTIPHQLIKHVTPQSA
ncbi:two-component sensor histidine kinase [Arenibacter certesii]|uniref:histidine kinase n=1 Tax=Arenibacter certesii TaxID=228955 RepID=A0A918MPP2_9FLAO|nr:two-component sensor histidine kinase [Arenibacter certesii]